jgi:hypothetical protein
MGKTSFSTHVANVRSSVHAWDVYPEFQTPGRLAKTKKAVDVLAARLLSAGSAAAEDKADVIGWVVRFRTEEVTVLSEPPPAADKASSPVAAAEETSSPAARKKARRESEASPKTTAKQKRVATPPASTKTSTRKPPTRQASARNPAVNGLAARGTAAPKGRGVKHRAEFAVLEDRYEATAFARGILSEVEEMRRRRAASQLLADLDDYQQRTRGSVAEVFYDNVLVDFRRWRTGLKAIAWSSAPGAVSYAPVPSELSSRRGGPVVSGGLPTLGRRR